jgi:uncharacterized membrane protein YkvA (DUF1232 family)
LAKPRRNSRLDGTDDPAGFPIDPSPMNVSEYTRSSLWPKTRRMLGRLRFLRQVIAIYYCAIDRGTPWAARGFALLAVAYFLVPIDLIPDWIPAIGFVDDGFIIAAAIRILGRYVTDEHCRMANAWPRAVPGSGPVRAERA